MKNISNTQEIETLYFVFYRSFCSIFQLWIKGAALPLNSYLLLKNNRSMKYIINFLKRDAVTTFIQIYDETIFIVYLFGSYYQMELGSKYIL